MDYGIFLKKLEQVLEEMKEASKKEFLLFSAAGEWLTGTTQGTALCESVRVFALSLAETQVQQGWIFLRVELHGETEYILLCGSGQEIEQSYVIGKMALCQIRNLFLSMQEPENRVNGLRQILNGEIPDEKIAEKCHQLRLNPGKYILYVIQYKQDEDSVLSETMKNLFVTGPDDFMIEMDATKTVLMKSTSDIRNENYGHYARVIVDNLQTEAMVNVWVGYSDPIMSGEKMCGAYRDACTALRVGTVFYGAENVFYYENLGIGRLIYKLPADLCEKFLQEVLGENRNIDFDEETMETISRLFDNNLNISETARQLYIHRNTLVYRLERIEKKLGLDIRTFEDAMLFKIAIMVRVHLDEIHARTPE
ncbi:MAG: helix-turn-helix domain-containing protein [Lachnospiraceae bacterium]|nr:helix-turn-helix domain-containing protein [Lachnospiraceae bacterium]